MVNTKGPELMPTTRRGRPRKPQTTALPDATPTETTAQPGGMTPETEPESLRWIEWHYNRCPHCHCPKVRTVDTYHVPGRNQTIRTHRCQDCNKRFRSNSTRY